MMGIMWISLCVVDLMERGMSEVPPGRWLIIWIMIMLLLDIMEQATFSIMDITLIRI